MPPESTPNERFVDALWTSPAMGTILHSIKRIGPTTLPVLITGESGTGKEVVARALHAASPRSKRRLVVVDCAAIPPSLMESELFGHRKGAFTGAATDRLGLVAAADQSTFFLDEIGELPNPVQVKLLRLLQDGSYRPVGANQPRTADLRVIAATNRDLEKRVETGEFRADLFHRINGCRIHIPPLRTRPEDIPDLLRYYMERFAMAAGRPVPALAEETQDCLFNSPWPGNVRELVNCAHYIATLTAGDVVQLQDLPPKLQASQRLQRDPIGPQADATGIRFDLGYMDAKRAWLELFERRYVAHLLKRHKGNVSAAARDAKMNRRSIQRILKRILTND